MKTIEQHLKDYEKNWKELPEDHKIGYKSGFEIGFEQAILQERKKVDEIINKILNKIDKIMQNPTHKQNDLLRLRIKIQKLKKEMFG